MNEDHYDEMLEKIKSMASMVGTTVVDPPPPSKEKKIQEILEAYEELYDIPNSAVFNKDGLLVATGFQKKYLNPDVLGGFGGKLFDTALQVIDELFAKPHHKDELNQYVEGDLPKRKTALHHIMLETLISFTGNDADAQPITVMITPISEIGFLVFLIEVKEHIALIKLTVPQLIMNLQHVLICG